jgi:hypothetical protein
VEQSAALAEARRIMADFVERTGLEGNGKRPQRYLWTDAYALCNLLSLYRRSGDREFRQLAVALVDQVHGVLGRHREDDPRHGWISGLDEATGREHPTAGGLRIGKKLGERGRGDAFDERLEWDRDGQYFHYLTKWMHALRRAAEVTGEARYCRWAVELAQAVHAGFARTGPGGGKRLAWKMSIDLSYPLVPSTGHHDPLDAWVTYNALGLCADRFPADRELPGLASEIAAAAAMLGDRRWHTDDALGIGGLLFDAVRVLQLLAARRLDGESPAAELARVSLESLESFLAHKYLSDPAEYRLAFRELGLAIGLRAVPRMREIIDARPGLAGGTLAGTVARLETHVALADRLESFWLERSHRRTRSWREHRDINDVMLATSLVPDEFLLA